VDNTMLIVVAILVIVAVVAIAFWASQRRRSDELRRRFGSEYDRAVGSAHDRRTGEAELRARQERVDALEIRPLDPGRRDQFAERWREIQAMFVDDPGNAVDQADTLIGEVMRARGYPVGDFEQRAADISVNHPQVVDHYRTAHSIAIKRESGGGATEQLRQAFVHYRALFADLLETPAANGTDEPAAARRADEATATNAARPDESPRSVPPAASSGADTRTSVRTESEQAADAARRS
jgi:hypothetical protein